VKSEILVAHIYEVIASVLAFRARDSNGEDEREREDGRDSNGEVVLVFN
jgi:hypothetical protein